jgi:hypothetical protein
MLVRVTVLAPTAKSLFSLVETQVTGVLALVSIIPPKIIILRCFYGSSVFVRIPLGSNGRPPFI